MDSVYVTTTICDVYKPEKRRPRSVLLEMEEKKKSKPCSTLVKSLILTIALLVICCLVLLNLYLVERAKKPEAVAMEKPVNSSLRIAKQQSYYGGSCWSTDCLHAASGRRVYKF